MARSRRLRFVSPVVLIFLGLGLYAFWYEPSGIRAVHYTIELNPAERISPRPLRVAVISDLHAGAPYIGLAKIERVVALANEQKPDFILLTGDYVITEVIGGAYIPIEATVAELRALTAPMGVYAVLGNHDDVDDPIKIADAFEQAGIRVLRDKAAELEQDDGPIYLIGFKNFFDGPVMDVVPANVPPGAHVLCFTHSPDVFPLLPSNCALTVAGHTHGGQVLLPILGRLIVPSRYGQRYAAGVIRENGKTLFVSTGIGTTFIPVRFGVAPEVSILEIW